MKEIDVSQIRMDYPAQGENESSELEGYRCIDRQFIYSASKWENAVGVAKNVTRAQAKAVADRDPSIVFFFYVKAKSVFTDAHYDCYNFNKGDAVFFRNEPWWNFSLRDCDAYLKL